MRYARQASLGNQVFECLWPGWNESVFKIRIRNRNPMGIGGFVTPLRESRHDSRVLPGAAKSFHCLFALPHCQSPERVMRVHQEASAEKPCRSEDLSNSLNCV